MNEVEKPEYRWDTIPWQKLERSVFKLQKRIYKASQREDVQTTRRLQKLMIKSWGAKCLAVRRVTQDNQGKKTAGVDGVKSLTPKQRLELVNKLRLSSKVDPTRRVWIEKPGKDEKRPLGIPTMKDRATQALVKLALEPEWVERVDSLNNKIIGKNQKLSVKEGCLPPPGRRVLNLTHTDSDQDAHVKMQLKLYFWLSTKRINMF